MKPTTDPLTGTKRFPCERGHEHRLEARAKECDAKPKTPQASAAQLFGKTPNTKIRARAESMVRTIRDTQQSSGVRLSVWRHEIERFLSGGVIEVDVHSYELGAHWALEVIARLPSYDVRVIDAELRALAIEASWKIRDTDSEALEALETRACRLLSTRAQVVAARHASSLG